MTGLVDGGDLRSAGIDPPSKMGRSGEWTQGFAMFPNPRHDIAADDERPAPTEDRRSGGSLTGWGTER